MDSILLHATQSTPEITLNPESRVFRIRGKSLPDDSLRFYEPIMNWLEEYIKKPIPKTNFEFDLDVMNLGSSKTFLFMLYKLKELKDRGFDVLVTWRCPRDNEDMICVGEDYEFMVDIPFKFSLS